LRELARIWEFFLRQTLTVELLILIVSTVALILAFPVTVFYTDELVRSWRKRTARERLEELGCNADVLDQIGENYVRPDCQFVDPAEGGHLLEASVIRVSLRTWIRELLANPRALPRGISIGAKRPSVGNSGCTREDLFNYIDGHLLRPEADKFILLLADTGMGKTVFLANYLAHRVLRRKRSDVEAVYLSLNNPGADALRLIEEIGKERGVRTAKTVLLLDGLDEDVQSLGRPGERLLALLAKSQNFHRVIVTSRTQLFGKDNVIPTDSHVPRNVLRDVGHGSHKIEKLYCSPFSLAQEDAYLRRKFWKREDLRRARETVRKMDDLSARPLLLSHIDATFSQETEIKRTSQVYELLVDKWTAWDEKKKKVDDPAVLREFLECLAVELYTRWAKEMGDVIGDSEPELQNVAARFKTKLPKEIADVCVRSLLTRDAKRNLKFAHRSILEYLFVARFRKFPDETWGMARLANGEPIRWGEQMRKFYLENSLDSWEKDRKPIIGYEKADLSGLENIKRIGAVREVPLPHRNGRKAGERHKLGVERSAAEGSTGRLSPPFLRSTCRSK
jgi:hypothetical protein